MISYRRPWNGSCVLCIDKNTHRHPPPALSNSGSRQWWFFNISSTWSCLLELNISEFIDFKKCSYTRHNNQLQHASRAQPQLHIGGSHSLDRFTKQAVPGRVTIRDLVSAFDTERSARDACCVFLFLYLQTIDTHTVRLTMYNYVSTH